MKEERLKKAKIIEDMKLFEYRNGVYYSVEGQDFDIVYIFIKAHRRLMNTMIL